MRNLLNANDFSPVQDAGSGVRRMPRHDDEVAVDLSAAPPPANDTGRFPSIFADVDGAVVARPEDETIVDRPRATRAWSLTVLAAAAALAAVGLGLFVGFQVTRDPVAPVTAPVHVVRPAPMTPAIPDAVEAAVDEVIDMEPVVIGVDR
jgi:hypothetical protein